jgi:3-isopropylmalate/(R)-2-methylmalate dehydratase small subunit
MSGVYDSMSGRVWLFGDNIDTDQIIQGRYLTLLDYKEMAQHTFEIPRPEFAQDVKKNDIVVAGRNFGLGSSREEAPQVLVHSGVGCVLAESFARIFYRNAFNVGLPVMIVPDISSQISDGTVLDVNLIKGKIKDTASGQTLQGSPIPSFMRQILEAGGAVRWFQKRKK